MTASWGDAAASDSLWHGRQGTSERLTDRRDRFAEAFVFVVPLLLPVEFAVGGQLFLPEVVLLLALPFLLDDARRRGVSRISHGVVVLGALWLFGLFFTDIYRGTPFHDYSRGWSNVVFFLVSFASLSLLIDGRWRRVMLFAVGLAIGETLQFIFHPIIYAAGDPWKFGYGEPVTLAGVMVASLPTVYRRPIVSTGILVMLGVINLKMGFRNLAGTCLLAAFLILIAARSTYRVRLDRRAFRTITILATSVLAGFMVVAAYGYAARQGVLGVRAQQKYNSQQGKLGILIGGRREIIAEVLAIRDSPIIGHGSWAKDPKYAAAAKQVLFKAGYTTNAGSSSSDLIPTHSYLFGAWVAGGIPGAVFWLWAFALGASVLLRLHRLADGRVVLVAFLGSAFLWYVLFSPLGAGGRLVAAFYLIVVLLARKDVFAVRDRQDTH